VAYVKQPWVDGSTLADANHMNHIEDGIFNVDAAVAAVKSEVTGDVIWSVAATRPNSILADGSTYDGTNALYTPLWVKLGSPAPQNAFVVPDLRERVAVGKGPQTALLANDGVAVANRRNTKHRHTPHSHTIPTVDGGAGGGIVRNALTSNGTGATNAADGGSGVATDPLDGPGFVALNPFIVL
jgi:hypothetical protein